MEKIFIKPRVAGQVIRHPEKMHHIISQQGEWVTNSFEWQRKLLQGDIVIAKPAPAAKQEIKSAVKQKLNKEGDE
jgi:hypothetical protein